MASKRKLDGEDDELLDPLLYNTTGKAMFVRNQDGDLVTVLPGQVMPAKMRAATEDAMEIAKKATDKAEEARLANRSAEDIAYEAYQNAKDGKRGNVWIANAGQGSSDRAQFADSISAEIAAERERSGMEYRPAAAHDRKRAFKQTGVGGSSSSGGGSFGGAMSVAAARQGASAAQAALERAQQASDDEEDEASLRMPATQVCAKAMGVYNMPISNQAQLDTFGNDLRVPQLERKLRKFLECFAEDASIKTVEGRPVLADFEAIRKRYGTVFRESGAELRGEVTRQWAFVAADEGDGDGGVGGGGGGGGGDEEDDGDEEDEDDDDGEEKTFCLAFERHSSLVTPKPGLPLDGSMGVAPPRTQDLCVLYKAVDGEIAGMWIAPDAKGMGSDPSATQQGIEATELFASFRRLVAKQFGGRAKMATPRYTCFVSTAT